MIDKQYVDISNNNPNSANGIMHIMGFKKYYRPSNVSGRVLHVFEREDLTIDTAGPDCVFMYVSEQIKSNGYNVSDALPEKQTPCLVIGKYGPECAIFDDDGLFKDSDGVEMNITNWMPITEEKLND